MSDREFKRGRKKKGREGEREKGRMNRWIEERQRESFTRSISLISVLEHEEDLGKRKVFPDREGVY